MVHRCTALGLVGALAFASALASGCGDDNVAAIETSQPGVVFSYPRDGQLDIPLGARIVVAFSDPVVPTALGTCTANGGGFSGGACIVGPDGPVDAMADVGSGGQSIEFVAPALEPGTRYGVYISSALDPTAANLPATGPLFSFTTRSERSRAAAPTLVAVNGGLVADVATTPMDQFTTIRLLFSEPLDPRTVVTAANSVELVDGAGSAVPATVLCDGLHISIDPTTDLTAGVAYEVKLGAAITDLSGTPLVATSVTLTPSNSAGSGMVPETLRTRQAGDPGAALSRSGTTPNTIVIDKPLIGHNVVAVKPAAIATQLGDAAALGGPIAFTIRRGQRLSAQGLDIKLGGTIPSGLSTGDVYFEFLTDSGGRLYRNPYQPLPSPDNDRSPVYVDLTFDIGIFCVDPTGNAVLAQTVLGVTATGTAIATDGVLDIESVAAIEMALLGVTVAPTNMVLELVTDDTATVPVDTTAPTLIASLPADLAIDHPVDDGVDLIFSEPIDLDRARGGGLVLANAAGTVVPSEIESRGSALVIRPIAPLAYSTTYNVTMPDVADVAGNALIGKNAISFHTPTFVGTGVAMTIVAVQPGAPCALTGGTADSPGRCVSGDSGDDLYQPFTVAANESVHVEFSTAPVASTIVLGTACNAGTVRVELVDGGGACTAAVPGSLVLHERSFDFVPDLPFTVGTAYRLTLVSGGNNSCGANEVCGISGPTVSFDPLAGMTSGNGGGPNLVQTFTATAASDGVAMVAEPAPYTDVNASGAIETGETPEDANRAMLKVIGVSGSVSAASFEGSGCGSSTDGSEACLYLLGAMPVELGDLQMNCPLPDGTMAASCIPVIVSAQAMYATSATMDATAEDILPITSPTNTTLIRIREPKGGPVTGYIVDDGSGNPEMVVALDLYMDAPDLSVTASSHDLHSKPVSVALAGPVTFLPDGRIAINLASALDVPVTINIVSLDFLDGGVALLIPQGEMKLQLLSPALRGGAK